MEKKTNSTKEPWKPVRLEKELFKAVMFAKKMIGDGMAVGLACYKSGQYYGYSASDVAWGLNQLKQPKNRVNRA